MLIPPVLLPPRKGNKPYTQTHVMTKQPACGIPVAKNLTNPMKNVSQRLI